MEKIKNIFNNIKSINVIPCLIKAFAITALIIGGFFWQPLMLIALIFAGILIALEFNVNSLYLILFLSPFMHVFGNLNLNFWEILLHVYILILLSKTIYRFIKKTLHFDWKILTIFLVLIIYLLLPIADYYNIDRIVKAIYWLTLFYLLIVCRKEINFKIIFNCFLWGILISCFIGLFIHHIAYLKKLIPAFYINGYLRFSGLTINPNYLYQFITIAISVIFVNVLLKKCSIYNLAYILPLSCIGFSTISKTFLICMIAFFSGALLALIIKPNKYKASVVCLTLVVCIVGALLVYGHTISLFSRLDVVENSNPSIGNQQSSNVYDELFTGRIERWKLYLTQFISSPQSIIFGNGFYSSLYTLTPGGCHSSIIQVLYDFGLFGTTLFLGSVTYLLIYLKFFKFNWITFALLPFAISFIPMIVELCFLREIWCCLIIVVVLVLSTNLTSKIDNKDPENTQQSIIS